MWVTSGDAVPRTPWDFPLCRLGQPGYREEATVEGTALLGSTRSAGVVPQGTGGLLRRAACTLSVALPEARKRQIPGVWGRRLQVSSFGFLPTQNSEEPDSGVSHVFCRVPRVARNPCWSGQGTG